MGREVRRVPADWQHPRDAQNRLKPLYPGEDYKPSVDHWDKECALWKTGWRPEYCTDAEDMDLCYEQWAGQRPHRDEYMPDWPAEQRTHYMMYETTTEGTPISPAFDTPEALARWLVDTGASAFGSETGSYDGWLRIARGGYAPSLVCITGVLMTGVDAPVK